MSGSQGRHFFIFRTDTDCSLVVGCSSKYHFCRNEYLLGCQEIFSAHVFYQLDLEGEITGEIIVSMTW